MANVNPFFGGSATDLRPPVDMANGAHPMNSAQNVVDDLSISRNAAVVLALAIGVTFALHLAGFRFTMTVNA